MKSPQPEDDMAARNTREASAPTAWVVLGSSGQYSDWNQWAVCVCLDEQSAKDRVGQLSSATRIHWAAKPEQEEGEDFNEWWDRSEAERASWGAKCSDIDPSADSWEQANYTACEVPLITSEPADAPEEASPRQLVQPIRDTPQS